MTMCTDKGDLICDNGWMEVGSLEVGRAVEQSPRLKSVRIKTLESKDGRKSRGEVE